MNTKNRNSHRERQKIFFYGNKLTLDMQSKTMALLSHCIQMNRSLTAHQRK